jgi:hypothetical protein
MRISLQIRPKYSSTSSLSPDEIAKEIEVSLEKSESVTGRVINANVYLKIPERDMKYWSPELNVRIKENDKGSIIKGVAGPNSKIWATVMVLYGLSVMLFIFGGALGISEKMLGIDSVWIWSVPGSVVLFALVFIVSKFGERLSNGQLILLADFLDNAIESAKGKPK